MSSQIDCERYVEQRLKDSRPLNDERGDNVLDESTSPSPSPSPKKSERVIKVITKQIVGFHGKQTVHIMMVVAGLFGNERRRFELQAMLNSLFYFRTSPVHLHFFVDEDAEKV